MYHNKPIDFRLRKNQRLRADVFVRDKFTCVVCGWKPQTIPAHYDGRYAVPEWSADRHLQVDHRTPRAKGGTNHPDNLQTMCSDCNTRKGAVV
jgi:5-methylcytosine-specific restriction endonuclease McrA